jgi:hypothetical protein
LINELKQHYNLSLGFDGGTTKGKQSIYTVHVTTADREVYLIKGDEASGFSHTGAHICKLILGVSSSKSSYTTTEYLSGHGLDWPRAVLIPR